MVRAKPENVGRYNCHHVKHANMTPREAYDKNQEVYKRSASSNRPEKTGVATGDVRSLLSMASRDDLTASEWISCLTASMKS
jgi:hypothetical protein